MRGEVKRAELAFLLARHRDEQNRSLRLRGRAMERIGHFEDRRDARRVVHRAVVDRVAVDRAADTEVIEVRGQHDVFVAQSRIAAAQDAGDVLRLHLCALDGDSRLQARAQREARHRPSGIDEREQLCEGVPRAGEQLVGVRGVHRDRQLLPGGFAQRPVRERHRRLQPRERRARPRDVHALRVGDADGADRAGGFVHLPALGRGSEMGLQRPRERPRRRRDVHDDRAFERQAGKVVNLPLGNVQTVADEDQRGLDGRSGIDAHADVRVLAQRQRLGLAAFHEGEARFRFDDRPRLEGDRLDVAAVRAGRLEAVLLELRGDVVGGALVPGAAGVAAFHAVVGERFDVRPPA